MEMGNKRQVIEDRFDIMPLAEIASRLAKYKGTVGGIGKIGWLPISKLAGLRRNIPRQIVNGEYEERLKADGRGHKDRMSDKQLRLLSRILRQLETGELTYVKGEWIYQEATKPLPVVSRIVMAGNRPVVQKIESVSGQSLPSFGSIFRSHEKIQLPKHLLGGKSRI